jgi:hypothetical protein
MRNGCVRMCKVGLRFQGRTSTLRSRDPHGQVVRERQVLTQVSCPQIRLCGLWLEKSGFHVGDVLTVHVADGQIILRKEVNPDAMGVQPVGGGQGDGPSAGLGGLSLVEGRAEAV